MRALLQRVSMASVKVEDENYFAKINEGMVLFLGISEDDTEKEINYMVDKCCKLRIFEDHDKKMNLSIKEIKGEILIVSQFTLYGDTKKGNRPSFNKAAKPETAEKLYNKFVSQMIRNLGIDKIKEGIFAAMMEITIINQGPVTVLVESK